MRGDLSTIETKDLKLCPACMAEVRAHDRFCRLCGTEHKERSNANIEKEQVSKSLNPSRVSQNYDTNRFTAINLHHRVSGALVNAIVEGISEQSAACLNNHFTRRAIPALLLIPIWLMIILLSPLDAYVTTKIITKEGRFRV